MNEYLSKLYGWVSNKDASFSSKLTEQEFIEKMENDPEYNNKIYSWISGKDAMFSTRLPLNDFQEKTLKKKEIPIVSESESDAGLSEPTEIYDPITGVLLGTTPAMPVKEEGYGTTEEQVQGITEYFDRADVTSEELSLDPNLQAAIDSGVISQQDLIDAGYQQPDQVSTISSISKEKERFAKNKISALRKKTEEEIDLAINQGRLNESYVYEKSASEDTFVEDVYGEAQLALMNINPKDFDGFLEERGYKKDYLDKQERGLFENKYGTYSDPKIAQEIEKTRMLNLYVAEQLTRDIDYQKLLEEKETGVNPDYTDRKYSFRPSSSNVNTKLLSSYMEVNMPNLTKKLKEKDQKNQKLYQDYKDGGIGVGTFTGTVFKEGWKGFEDRVQNLSASMYGLLGKTGIDYFSNIADATRMQIEQEQMFDTDNLSYAYVSGKRVSVNGTNYLVDENDQIYDLDAKIVATPFLDGKTTDNILNQAQTSGVEDSSFSTRGATFQTANVVGDMIVQIALTRGAQTTLRSAGALTEGLGVLGKTKNALRSLPMSRGMSSAIIAQTTMGASSGYEDTMRLAKDAGLNEEEARELSHMASTQMAVLYALTAPISPQTKATEAFFGKAKAETLKKALEAYKTMGNKGFMEVFKKTVKDVINLLGEGIKEAGQENIQQAGETLIVNRNINEQAGLEIAKDTITGDDFINTTILSLAAGMIMPGAGSVSNAANRKARDIMGMSGIDRIKNLDYLVRNEDKLNELLETQLKQGMYNQEAVDAIRSEIETYKDGVGKLPKNIRPEVALEIMEDIASIRKLESQRKQLDPAFHQEIDDEIKDIRERIKQKRDAIQEQETRDIPDAQPAEGVQEVEEEVRVTPEEEVAYTAPETVEQRRAENELISAKEAEERGLERIKGQRWVVVNKVTGKLVYAPVKAEAQAIIDNMDYDYGEGDMVSKQELDNIRTPKDVRIESEVQKLRDLFAAPEQISQIDNAEKALSAVAPDVKIVVHKDEDSYAEATNEQNRTQKTAGEYNPATKTIHINATKANVRTVAHETFHAILLNFVKTDAEAQRITEAMMKAVAKNASPELKAYLDEFASNYSENIQAEEKLAELVGKLASEYDSLPKPTQSVVKRWLDRLAKVFGLKPFTDTEVIDVLNTISRKIATGEAVTQQDLSSIQSNAKYVSQDEAKLWGTVPERKQVRTKPEPKKTVTAYKMFRVKKSDPGKLFPLFVKADEEVLLNTWLDAEVGELTKEGKVKSKIGKLAYRPGWHMGDLPIATHIGDKYDFKKGEVSKALKKPTARSANHVWAEVEVAADVNWQEEANKRASRTKDGKIVPRTAHITDRLPEDGYYRYKTNPNMTGEWLIGGSIKVTRVLTDEEVKAINDEAGVADLPRVNPINLQELGFELADSELNEDGVSGTINSGVTKRNHIVGDVELKRFPTNPNTTVKEGVSISELNGKKTSVIESDRMTGAYIVDQVGNPMYKFFGGIYFPVITGKFWASRKLSTANSIAKNINLNRDKDGYVYASPMIMKPNSHMSNQDMFETVWEFMKFDLRSPSTRVTRARFFDYIESALSLKGVGMTPKDLGLRKSDNIETIVEKMTKYMVGDDKTLSFEQRKKIIKSLLGDPKVKGDRRFPSAGSISEVASKFEEEAVKDVKDLWDIVMVIRTKGTLSAKITEDTDPFFHKSYPAEISSDQPIEVLFLDGAYNVSEVLPELTKSSGETFSWQEYSERHPSTKFALSQYGRTGKLSRAAGTIQSPKVRKQLSESTKPSELVRRAKREGISDEAIRQFGQEMGMSVESINSAIDNYVEPSGTDVNNIRKRSEKALADKVKNKTFRSVARVIREKLLDRQTRIKDLLNGIGSKEAGRAANLLVTKSGGSGYANFRVKEAIKKIYDGLSQSDISILDEIIYARRIISINENRDSQGKEKYKGIDGYNESDAQNNLDSIAEQLGEEKYNDLVKRSEEYFKSFDESLERMRDAGLISEDVYNQLKDVEYSPIKTIKYLVPEDYDAKEVDRMANITGLTSEVIKKLSDENINEIIMDSQWLLTTNIGMIEARIFENRMLNAFNDAVENATAEEKAGFEEVILENPPVKKTKDGRVVRKYDKQVPVGYAKVEFVSDGQKKYIVIKEEYAKQLLDIKTKPGSLEKAIPKLTGVNVLRFLATSGNPLFIVGNTAVDFANILFLSDVYSKNKYVGGVKLAADFVKAFISKIGNTKQYNKIYKEFMEHGGAMDYLSVDGLKALKGIASKNIVVKGAKQAMQKYGRVMSYFGELSEVSFRLAVYEKQKQNLVEKFKKENGRDPNEDEMKDIMFASARESRETIDFAQGGSYVKAADKAMPYLNAATQGFRKAFDYASKNPLGFASSALQYMSMAGGFAALSMFNLLRALDDEDDDVLEVLESISDYEKSNYHIIFTGEKDKNGEHKYVRIKKLPIVSPLSTIAEQMVISKSLESRGVKYDISDEAINKSLRNIAPVDIRPEALLQRNPLLSATLTYLYNYDMFYDQPVFRGPKGKKIDPTAEGILDSRVDQIYKDLAPFFGMSPKRTKAAVEKIITSESTNPMVGLIYSGYDVAFKDDTEIGKEMTQALQRTLKSSSKKLVRSTNKNLIRYKDEAKIELDETRIETEIYKKEQKVYNTIREAYKDGGSMTNDEFISLIKESFDPIDQKRYAKKYVAYIRNMNSDPAILDIVYEDTPEVQALLIFNKFGDSFEEDEIEEIKKVYRASGRKFSKKGLYIYRQKYLKK